MRTIYKYPIASRDQQTIQMGHNAKPIAVQFQHGVLCIWAEVENHPLYAKLPTKVTVSIYGTGHPLPDESLEERYLGTVQQDGLVWHVYTL